MKTKFIACLLMIFAVVSCKKEEKQATDDAAKTEQTGPKLFKVTVDVNIKKDDAFHLYYSEDGTDKFSEESSIWVEFKANADGNQQVIFNLPEGAVPTNFRLDMGNNKDQEDIMLKNFKMEYAGKSFDIAPANFLTFFRINELNTVYDAQKGMISPIKTQKVYSAPSFYSLPPLEQEIQKIVQ